MSELYISRHAEQRLRERSGLNKSSVIRIAHRAYNRGISHCETKGDLKKWISELYLHSGTANNIKIYGDKAFLFHYNELITVLQVPQRFANNMSNYVKQKKR